MAELSDLNPSLADVLSRTDPNGNISMIIEAAARANGIIGDATGGISCGSFALCW